MALGRALVREPQVFLMDEPLSNLDAQLRAQTRGEIRRLQQEIGTTTVYVTHDQVEAMTMGDRIAVMNAGASSSSAPRAQLYEQPGNRFVAGFIGSPAMSFARVRAADGRLRGPGVDVPAPAGADGELVLGVRPEHARLWADGAGLLGPLEGVVAYVEALGRETFLGVEVADGVRFVVDVEGGAGVGPGDRVRFGLVASGVRLFHPDGEIRQRGSPTRS